jgi:hypothetical protein
MPWLRVIQWDFSFDCCYEGNAQLSKTPFYRNRRHIKKFLKRPLDDLETWARERAMELSLERANYSCKELAAKFSGCLVELLNFRFSEVLIPGFKVRLPTGVEVILPPRKPLKIELAQLELLESKLSEYGRKLDDLRNNLKGANETILRRKGVTEAEEPNVKTYVKVAKAARTRLRNSIKVQKEIIDRQKKTIEDYKTKIGFVE